MENGNGQIVGAAARQPANPLGSMSRVLGLIEGALDV